MIPSERSSSDIPEYILFRIKTIFSTHNNPFLGGTLIFFETHYSKSVDFSTFIYEVNIIYSWAILIMCCVKVWKYTIAVCSLVLCRGSLIRCAILIFVSRCPNGTDISHAHFPEQTSKVNLAITRLITTKCSINAQF